MTLYLYICLLVCLFVCMFVCLIVCIMRYFLQINPIFLDVFNFYVNMHCAKKAPKYIKNGRLYSPY